MRTTMPGILQHGWVLDVSRLPAQWATQGLAAIAGAGRRAHMVAVMLLNSALMAFLYRTSELLPANEGLGFDGSFHANLVRSIFPVLKEGLNRYCLQRILPGLLLHNIFGLFAISPTSAHIVQAFRYLDITCIILSVVFWC